MKKVLFLSACPTSKDRIRFDSELMKIRNSLQIPEIKKQVRLNDALAINADTFCKNILDVSPNFLHLSMHGDNLAGLVFESTDGLKEEVYINEARLKGWLDLFNFECIVFNCCYSGLHADKVKEKIHYVIAVEEEIDDDDAINFSTFFYDALFKEGSDIEFSYKVGKAYAKFKKGYDSDDDISLFLIKHGNKIMDNLPDFKADGISEVEIESLIDVLRQENQQLKGFLHIEQSEFSDLSDFLKKKKFILARNAAKRYIDLNSKIDLIDLEEDLISYIDLIDLCLETERFNSLNDPLLGTETEEEELEILIKSMKYVGNSVYQLKGKGISDKSIVFFNQAISHLVARLEQ